MIHGTLEDVIGALASTVAAAEWRLASVLDAAAEAILIVADDGTVVFFNQACERLFGYAAGQIVGGDVTMLLPPQAPGGDGWKALLRAPDAHAQVTLRGRGGEEFAADVTVTSAKTADGQHYLVMVRKKMPLAAEEAAAQADLVRAARGAAMDELSAALAHKLNQPLTAVILYLQAIGRAFGRETSGSELPEKVAAILDKAVREAERASRLLQCLRQGRGHDAVAPEPTDINQAVEDAIGHGRFGDRGGAQIDRLLTPRLPPVRVERDALQQVLIALIRSALARAVPGRAAGVRLTTRRFADHVAVMAEVPAASDGGEFIGNCAESTDGRRNCEKDLAIARAIAHGHGGDLTVDGDGRDRGTRFTLRLPLLAGAAPPL